MKRSKPDILIMLALILGLGVTFSTMTQGQGQERVNSLNPKASGIMLGSDPRY